MAHLDVVLGVRRLTAAGARGSAKTSKQIIWRSVFLDHNDNMLKACNLGGKRVAGEQDEEYRQNFTDIFAHGVLEDTRAERFTAKNEQALLHDEIRATALVIRP